MNGRRLMYAVFVIALFVLLTAGTPAFCGTTGVISGTVIDSVTNEALPGVNIILEGTRLTTVTDDEGYYVFTNVAPGTYKVTASLVGYTDAQVSNVSVVMDVTTKADFSLAESVAEEEETIVVEARPIIQNDVVPTMYIVESNQEKMTKSQPNLLYQAPGIVGTLPGVVRDVDGTPHIRGGRADQIGWTIDGIPVFDPVSNSFGTNLVTVGMDKMEVFTGGYRPEYGNAISGVLNEVVKTGRTAPGLALQTMNGSLDFRGAYPEIGGSTDNGFDYYAAAYLWKSGLEHPVFSDVDSSDLIGKFNYELNDRNTLTFLAAQGSAEYLIPAKHTETYRDGALVTVSPTDDQQHQSHLLTAFTLNHRLDSKSFITFSPYYFRSRVRLDAIGRNDNSGWYSDAESSTTGLKLDYTNQLSSQHLLKAGAIRMASQNRYLAIVPYMNDYVNYIAPLMGLSLDLGDYEYTANTDSVQTGVYVSDQWSINDRWLAEMGLRYDRMAYDKVVNPDTKESQVSPRLGASYSIDSKEKLRFSWGKMIQFPRTQAVERIYTDPGWESVIGMANADLEPERCTQYDLGWEREIAKGRTLSVTPFYRKYENLLQTRVIDPSDPWGASVFENLGAGKSHGLEVLMKQSGEKFSGWFSYTYSVAKAESSIDQSAVVRGVESYVDWDQRHTAVAVLNYLNKGWTYNFTGEYGSGLPWGHSNSKRAPSHLVFDMNVSKDVKGGLFPAGQINFGVANIFNVHTILDRDFTYDPDTGEETGSQPTAWTSPRFVTLNYTRKY